MEYYYGDELALVRRNSGAYGSREVCRIKCTGLWSWSPSRKKVPMWTAVNGTPSQLRSIKVEPGF
jgi:hypothetical protein